MKKSYYSVGEVILMILALPFLILWELIKISGKRWR